MTHEELRALLIRTDSITSLIAYRYPKDIPRELLDELKNVSGACRSAEKLLREEAP